MLKEKIQQELKQAMLAKDEFRLSVLRMLKSALQYYEIQKGGAGYEATDEDIIEVAGKEIKKRKESIEMYKNAGREEMAEKEEKEVEILQSFLPEQLSEDAIKDLIDDAITKTGASELKDMGKVMGALMPQIKGKADNSLVSALVREKLSS